MPKILIATVVALLTLAGCNTMKGAGEDISSAGNAVTGTAADTQDQM